MYLELFFTVLLSSILQLAGAEHEEQQQCEKQFIHFHYGKTSHTWSKLRTSKHSVLNDVCQQLFQLDMKSNYNREKVEYHARILHAPIYKVKFYHVEHNPIPVDVLHCIMTSQIQLLGSQRTMKAPPSSLYLTEGNTSDSVFLLMRAQKIDLTSDEIIQELYKQRRITKKQKNTPSLRSSLLERKLIFPFIPNTFRIRKKVLIIE